MSWEVIIVAVISFLGNALATFFSNNKTQALLEYRLTKLEEKQDKHNSVIERTYKLEKDLQTAFNKLDVVKEEVNELKKGQKP